MKAWKPCDKCKDKTKVENLPGWYFLNPNSPNEGARECECHVEWKYQGRRQIQAQKNGVPLDLEFHPLVAYSGSKDIPKVKKLISYVQKSFPVLRDLTGVTATVYLFCRETLGHAELLGWMAKSLYEGGWNVGMFSMRQITNDLVPLHLFEDEELDRAKAFHQRLVDLDFLFITSAFLPQDATGNQAHRMVYLDRFLMDRMLVKQRPTIFLTSTSLTELGRSAYPQSTQELIAREVKRSGGELTFSSGREIEIKSIFEDEE